MHIVELVTICPFCEQSKPVVFTDWENMLQYYHCNICSYQEKTLEYINTPNQCICCGRAGIKYSLDGFCFACWEKQQ